MASILLYDDGHIKWLELNPSNFQLVEKVVSPQVFAGLYGVMKFGEHILALAYHHPEKLVTERNPDQLNALLIFDLNLELKEVKEFMHLEVFTHWQRAYLFLCSQDNLYILDQHLQIISSDTLAFTYKPIITSFNMLPDHPTGFVLENSPIQCFFHQVIYDQKRFVPHYNTVEGIGQLRYYLNTQTYDQQHNQWHIFGAYDHSQYSSQQESRIWLYYSVNPENWEVDYKDNFNAFDLVDHHIFEKFHKIRPQDSPNNEHLTLNDIITNEDLPESFDAVSIDILAITPQTPGWGIIRESKRYYLAQFNFGVKQTLTLSHFTLLDDFEDISFESQLMVIDNFLFVVYIDEQVDSDYYILKVFDISNPDNPHDIHTIKAYKDIEEAKFYIEQHGKPCFDFFV